jgi:hypothetical protein
MNWKTNAIPSLHAPYVALLILLAGCAGDSTRALGNGSSPASRSADLGGDVDAFTEWSPPVNLGASINSEFTEAGSFITRDGLTLYFTSNRPGGCGATDIWVSTRSDVEAQWGTPQNLGCIINSTALDAAPVLSLDEHRMYFHTRRPGIVGVDEDLDIYVSRRRDTSDPFGWEAPERLSMNTDFGEAQPVFFADDESGIGTLFFVSDQPGGLGRADIWSSTILPDGTFAAAAPVAELNSSFRDQAPFIRRDGLEMFLSSEREHPTTNPADMSGLDLFVATRRTPSDPWSTPVNLDDLNPSVVINSPVLDDRPTLSFDATTLYFQSPRAGGFGANDIYVLIRSKLRQPE